MSDEKKPYRDLEITHRNGKTIVRDIPHKKAERFIKGAKGNPAWETLRFNKVKKIRQLRPGTNETDCVPFGEREDS